MLAPDPAARPPRRPRFRAGLTAAAVLSTVVPAVGLTLASPAEAAFDTTMTFQNGRDWIDVGPNASIYIDGSLYHADDCPGEDDVQDFLYPASDVYIVPTGGTGGKLVDAGGKGPNTIVATATGIYIGEPIAFTGPGGSLGAGVYDVIFDTCQDGYFDGRDEIYFEAITVEMPDGELPPPSDAIARIKAREQELFTFWTSMHETLALMFKVDKAKAVLECMLTFDGWCLVNVILALTDRDQPLAQTNNHVEDLVLGLTLNVSKNHGAIWQDPPDADFEHLPVLGAAERLDVPSGGAVHDALTALIDPLADEVVLTEAYLHAIERYQGAQEAGDTEWALVHARAARDLAMVMADQLGSTTAVADLREAIADPANGVLAGYETGRQFVARLQQTGLTAVEVQQLRNAGLSEQDINRLEADIAGIGSLPVGDTGILGQLDQLLSSRAGAVSVLGESVADWDAVVAAIEASAGDLGLPVADAGGSYSGAVDGTVSLDASASSAATGSTIAAYEWELDGDGAFDDASGATPTVAVPVTGTSLVSVRVTDAAGRSSVDHAVLARTGELAAPAITATTPGAAAAVVVGEPQTFGVTTPTTGVGYAWLLDGTAVSADATFTYDPDAAAAGVHVLTVDVTGANGRTARRAWRVTVTTPDADGDGWTATPDCDDARADVHPGRMEAFGNGIDDDCDAGTADAPPGGLVGAAWSWGHFQGLGTGSFDDSHTPAPVPALSEVVQVESSHAGGVAIIPGGEVRTWGLGYGIVGDGTQQSRRTPVSPLGVGGAPGTRLTSVVQVASEGPGVIARLSGGEVVAWGANGNGQVGNGSSSNVELHPVSVVTADGTELTDAVDVAQGENTNYILRADGTVWTTGVSRCHGRSPLLATDHAVPAPLFGDDIVDIEAGDSHVIARQSDGTVLACGSSLPELGRGPEGQTAQQMQTPMPVDGFGPGSGIVDIGFGESTAVALHEDGTVFQWGRNLNGAMNAFGVDAGDQRHSPVAGDLPGDVPIVGIDHGSAYHVVAVRADGTTVSWGANNDGAAGTGSFMPNPALGFHLPAITGDVVATSVSDWNSLALVRPLDQPEWDRPLQWLDASAADVSIGEASGGTVPVALSSAAPSDVTVTWRFGVATGTTTIPAGSTSVEVAVPVTDDATDEDDEIVAFTIEDVSNGIGVERRTAMVTVVDDDAPPAASLASVSIAEGDTSLTDAVVRVSLSNPSGRDVAVDYATADGTAVAGEDYRPVTGTVLVPAGQTTADLHLAVIGDQVMEPHEAFTVTAGTSTATVAVTDDEPIVVTVTSPTVTEGDTGTTPAPFELTATAPPAGTTVELPWSVVPGTAEEGVDVDVTTGTATFDAAATTSVVEAVVVADDDLEPLAAEVFGLRFGAATASDGRPVVAADPGAATILEDDVADSVPVVAAGPDTAGGEGSAVALGGTVADDGAVVTTWSTSAAGCTIADPSAIATTITCDDDAVATVTLTADDGSNPAVSDDVTVTVGNVAPAIASATYVGGSLVVDFGDPGADTHSCSVAFGDGTAPVVVEPASAPCTVPHTYGPGSHTASITVLDDDGGQATASVDVTVATPYRWGGFHQPIDDGVLNTVQAGRSIPVKFSLGGDFGLDVLAEGSPASVPVACGTGLPTDGIEETATPGASGLTYDAGSGRYHYVWQTSRAWGGQCRMLVVTLADGTEHTALFRFR